MISQNLDCLACLRITGDYSSQIIRAILFGIESIKLNNLIRKDSTIFINVVRSNNDICCIALHPSNEVNLFNTESCKILIVIISTIECYNISCLQRDFFKFF